MVFFKAIEGIGTLKIGQWNQKMVPVKEMTDVLNVVKDLVQLKAKQWVRLKRGIFKDDLAQVSVVLQKPPGISDVEIFSANYCDPCLWHLFVQFPFYGSGCSG